MKKQPFEDKELILPSVDWSFLSRISIIFIYRRIYVKCILTVIRIFVNLT